MNEVWPRPEEEDPWIYFVIKKKKKNPEILATILSKIHLQLGSEVYIQSSWPLMSWQSWSFFQLFFSWGGMPH